MPTTRNHWQAEKINQQTQSSVKLQNAADELQEQTPFLRDDVGDLNPRSPKRRRISTAAKQENDDGLADQPHGATPNTQQPSDYGQSLPNVKAEISPNEGNPSSSRGTVTPEASSSPSTRTRLESLPVLDNLASQLLSILARLTPAEALTLSRIPDSQNGREYATVRSLFEHTRRLYRTQSPFLSANELGLREINQVDTLRKANQAIFMSSIFTGEIGLRDMNENFLYVFVPEQGRLLKAQGSIYLELKTQAFITARRTGAAEPNVVMQDLFPLDMDKRLLSKRPGAKSLAPSEHDFLKRLSSRRDILNSYIQNGTLDELPSRYRWEDFSREVSAYLSKNFESVNSTTSPSLAEANGLVAGRAPLAQGQMEGHFSIHTPPLPVPPDKTISEPLPAIQPSSPLQLQDDFVAQAARAAEIAMQDPAELAYQSPQPVPPPRPQPEKPKYQQVQTQFQHYQPSLNGSGSKATTPTQTPPEGEIPHNSQSAPTQVLYERARIIATAKTSSSSRKTNSPSQRRPWTTEEENALMTGLDRVKGPHWSQILAMYGPGGTINESLKDRNQVQLKDKARNLKLFFLKSGIEVPYYLKHVTGDLKTRAPAQASKQEAKEREKMQGDDPRTHFDDSQGIMALAGEMSNFGSPTGSNGGDHSMMVSQNSVSQLSDSGPDIGSGLLDVEAMIARAAAQASESLDSPGWGP